MKRCPTCAKAFPDERAFCPQDGATLEEVGDPGHALDTVPMTASQSAKRQATAALGSGNKTATLSSDEAMIGQVVADRYQIESVIGRGGMGVVFRARHLMLNRSVAIKLLRHQFVTDERAVGRFMREAQAMARIDHPNAAHVYDFGVLPNGLAYLAMEIIEGESLRSVLARTGPLPVESALGVMEHVCGAVEAAHREGIIHRDLKPENIMLKQADGGAIVKVVDFGLAKIAGGSDSAQVLTAAGELFGTPAYMAPEFFAGEEIDVRADVYALGAIAFEMLAGKPPFQGTLQAVIGSQLFKEVPSLAGFRPEISPELEAIVRRAMSKKREDRPDSAASLAALLRGEERSVGPTPSAPIVMISVVPVDEVASAAKRRENVATEVSNSSLATVRPFPRPTAPHPGSTSEMAPEESNLLREEETAQVDLTEEALQDGPSTLDSIVVAPAALEPFAPRRTSAVAIGATSIAVVSLLGIGFVSFPTRSAEMPPAPSPPVMHAAPDASVPVTSRPSAPRPAESEALRRTESNEEREPRPAVEREDRAREAQEPSKDEEKTAPKREQEKGEDGKEDGKKEKKRRWFDPRRWVGA